MKPQPHSLVGLGAGAVLGLALVGCDAHLREHTPVATVQRVPGGLATALPEFQRIEVRGPVDVRVREGFPASVAVTIETAYADRVTTVVDDDTLVVDYHPPQVVCLGYCEGSPTAHVLVDVPTLVAASVHGSGDLEVEGTSGHDDVELTLAGSGDLRYSGIAQTLHCSLDGSGDMTLLGSARRLDARVEGSGDIQARGFAAIGGRFEIDGSGDIYTNLQGGDTAVELNGSGDLRYTGEIRITRIDVSGSGEIRKE